MLPSASTLHHTISAAAERLTGRPVVAIVELPGGASLRRYHRVVLGPATRPAAMDGAAGSLIVMELGESPASEEASKSAAGTAELPFINVLRYLARGGIAVPALHAYDEPAGLLYLEDLGDDTLESRVLSLDDPGRRHFYRLAIAELVKLQKHAASDPTGCIAFGRGFDVDLLKWELDHFREWGLEVGAGVVLPPAERDELERQFRGIAERLAAAPRGFVHRDYQSRNLMVQDPADLADSRDARDTGMIREAERSPRIRVIDFQDALLGTRAYDLVALLRDSYVVLSSALLDQLIADYAGLAGADLASFRALFDLQSVQRKLKDAGRFIFIDRVKKNPGFLPYVEGSHHYVAEALRRLPELASLQEILARYLPAFR